ncbi:MAG: 5-(carboxyamino)imidazole ribonucleotide synthase [Chlamydiae bacterium CG10_big_fil_rev_8_21_14_0_10_35_9]|nr:MAG: 5-(carboxyamino)imidazole ribonucleotide synthase [Chlamydiae bacterium CG10_big_fil_rev_8_21_14_0_10_35_9]
MNLIKPGSTIGIIGGGQLGKMLILAAASLGYNTIVYCDQKDSPAFSVANSFILAEYDDLSALKEFADQCDVITFEFENIPHDSLAFLEENSLVRPSKNSLFISQNRNREKEFMQKLSLPTTLFKKIIDKQDLLQGIETLGFPCILKTAELGYDGKGQISISEEKDVNEALERLSGQEYILEKKIDFEKEISIIAARDDQDNFKAFSPFENTHKQGILQKTKSPADISQALQNQAVQMTKTIMQELKHIGVLTVEFFVKEGKLLINEIAPRVHNSGHLTIDACFVSQFEQHIRAICSLNLIDPVLHTKAEMHNLIGEDVHDLTNLIMSPTIKVHLYGKKIVKQGRKMGHVTKLLFP